MRKPAQEEEAYLVSVARKTAEKYHGEFPDHYTRFELLCTNKRCDVGDLVAVKWGESDMTLGRVKRKHNRILVRIGVICDEISEHAEWCAWFPFSDVYPVVEVRAGI